MSCSQGVHFQFIGNKVKNYVLPKNKIYVLPKSEIYVLAKKKTDLQTPIIQPLSLESHLNNVATKCWENYCIALFMTDCLMQRPLKVE